MKVSFSTAGLFPRDTLDALKLLENCGIGYAEVMPQSPYEVKEGFGREILKRLDRLRIASIHFPLVFFSAFYNPYEGMIEYTHSLVDDICKLGKMLEVKVIVIHPSPIFEERYKNELFKPVILDNTRYLCDKCKEYGIDIGVENGPNGEGKTPDGLERYIDEVGRENAGATIDTTEAYEAHQDVFEFVSKSNVIHMHLSDHDLHDKKHLPLGEGAIDWMKLIKVLKDREYKGYLTIELLYKYLLDSPEEVIKKNAEFLNDLLYGKITEARRKNTTIEK